MKNLKQWGLQILATICLGTFALAQTQLPGGAMSSSQIQTLAQAASGWTYNGTYSLATGDVGILTDKVLYLDGTTRVQGIGFASAGGIRVFGNQPLRPNSDQAINLGEPTVRWSRVYACDLAVGTSGALSLSCSNPTITSCTSASRTNGTASSAQYDVGTSCTGVSTITLTMPAASTGWECRARHITSGSTREIEQTGAVSTTSVTLTNFSRTTGLAVDFTDGDDVGVNCFAR